MAAIAQEQIDQSTYKDQIYSLSLHTQRPQCSLQFGATGHPHVTLLTRQQATPSRWCHLNRVVHVHLLFINNGFKMTCGVTMQSAELSAQKRIENFTAAACADPAVDLCSYHLKLSQHCVATCRPLRPVQHFMTQQYMPPYRRCDQTSGTSPSTGMTQLLCR